MKSYSHELSILKGLAILCIVIGHSGSALTHFVYLFHVCVFFIASGYTYSLPTTWKEYGFFVWKRLKRLYVPYVFYNLVFLAMNNLLVLWHVYPMEAHISNYLSHIIRIFLLIENAEIIGAAWFLRVLFMISIGYALVDFILSKTKYRVWIQGIISILFYTVGFVIWEMELNVNIYGKYLVILLTLYGFYYSGVILKSLMLRIPEKWIVWILFGTSAGLILCNRVGTIRLGDEYGFYGFFIITSFLGWFFLWSISYYLKRLKIVRIVLEFFSKQSIYIMLFHFVGFKIVTWIFIVFKGDSISEFTKFPIAYNGCSVFYVLGGLVISLALGSLISVAKEKIVKAGYVKR